MRQALFRSGLGHFRVFLATLLLAAAVAGQADAGPQYSGIVIDANTGRVLYESSANAPRFPASLTKMMTLYLTFEALSQGRISKSSRVAFSAHAAAQPPSKLGVKPGGTISVEDAIYALVTRSANDAATALGETLGGSEVAFARMMTAKARVLGMRNTVFRNANGLPNDAQRTTAADMATLGIALREHFPQYYGYFSTRSVVVAGKRLGNHNHLLGRVKGVDGIKTGYIRAAGFNIVTSVQQGGRSVVAVVMGGRTAKSRDAQMVELIQRYLPKASTRDGGPLMADRRPTAPAATVANAGALVLPVDDIPTPDNRPTESIVAYNGDAVAAPAAKAARAAVASLETQPVPTARPQLPVEEGDAGEGEVDAVETASTAAAASGWVIQVASVGSETEAKALLARVKQQAGQVLADATPFTEPFSKGGANYVRARYAGFASKAQAWGACGVLKRKEIACYAVER